MLVELALERLLETEQPPPVDLVGRPPSHAQQAVNFAHQIASPNFPRTDIAELRRRNPRSDLPFIRLLASHNIDYSDQWHLLLHCVAVLSYGRLGEHSVHDPDMSLGRALYDGSDPDRPHPLLTDSRLNLLLTARGDMLRNRLEHAVRMLAQEHVRVNINNLARLILDDDPDPIRRIIARHYYRAAALAGRRRRAEEREH